MRTAVRAMIMLTVLVGLPSAWVYYGPLPESAQRVVDRFVATAKEALGSNEPASYQLADGKDVDYMPASLAAAAPFQQPSPLAASEPPVTDVTPTPMTANPIEPLLERLRELGVVEYALERWGSTGELYRFHCEMPLGPAEGLTQQFEAVAADPRASVEQVVTEVASWHMARGGETVFR